MNRQRRPGDRVVGCRREGAACWQSHEHRGAYQSFPSLGHTAVLSSMEKQSSWNGVSQGHHDSQRQLQGIKAGREKVQCLDRAQLGL